MRRLTKTFFLLAALSLAACGVPTESVDSDGAPPAAEAEPEGPAVEVKPSGEVEVAGKPMSPIRVDYEIVGEPVVGQPVSVNLQVGSTLGPQPITLSYRISDASALALAESQLPTVTMSPPSGEEQRALQQVTVVPLREGRHYLNVSASIETSDGRLSTVTAIPIQVGDAPRVIRENGEVAETADGERLRVLPAKED